MKAINPIINLFAAFFVSMPCIAQIPVLKDYTSPVPKVVTPARVTPDGGFTAPSDAVSLFNNNKTYVNGQAGAVYKQHAHW